MENSIEHYYNHVRTDYGINSLRRKKILRLAEAEKSLDNGRILDIGCAGGYVSQHLRRSGNTIVGVDLSKKSVADATQVLNEAVCLNIETDPWPQHFVSNPFDIILCAEVIEHLFDQAALLQKLPLVLKPRGVVIFTTPNFLIWNNRIRMLLGQYGPKEIFFDTGHIHLLSYQGFVSLSEKNGFEIIAEDHLWYPNKLERWQKFLPKNLFVFQTIVKVRTKQA